MGNCVSGFKKRRHRKVGTKSREITLAVFGTDDAGKTTVIKALKGESLEGVTATVGFNRFDMTHNKITLTVYDLGGGARIRDIWSNYFAEIYGIIFVIDASNHERMFESERLLVNMIQHNDVQRKPILVLLNKQDRNGAMNEMDLVDRLDLSAIVNQYRSPCRVETCNALLGSGKACDIAIRQGLSWLLGQVEDSYEQLNERVQKAVTELKERQLRERQERAERVRLKQEAETRAENMEDLDGTETDVKEENSPAIANGRPGRNNRILPFQPLPQINEENSRTESATSAIFVEGGRKESRQRVTSLAMTQIEPPLSSNSLPPISPQLSIRRHDNHLSNRSDKIVDAEDRFSRHSKSDETPSSSQGSDGSSRRRKRRNRRLNRVHQQEQLQTNHTPPTEAVLASDGDYLEEIPPSSSDRRLSASTANSNASQQRSLGVGQDENTSRHVHFQLSSQSAQHQSQTASSRPLSSQRSEFFDDINRKRNLAISK